jgi:hypothetical protein
VTDTTELLQGTLDLLILKAVSLGSRIDPVKALRAE